MTNILAKELMKDDSPAPSILATKKPRIKEEEPKLGEADSLEELLDAAASRSS